MASFRRADVRARLAVLLLILTAFGAGCQSETQAIVVDLPRSLDDVAVVRRPPPSTKAPARAALLLHGSGSSPLRFTEIAEAVAEQGFVAIAVRGQRELGPGRYTWSSDFETHLLLGRVMELARRDLGVSAQRPVLVGFSLGATQAVRLLADHADSYAAAFAISPGPLATTRLMPAPVRRPLAILVGSADAPSEKAVAGIERAWDAADEPFWIVRHDGDHRPPEDWRARVVDAMTWMTVKAGS